ncbi:MAG TPA: hypothetical protein P5567_04965 [Kiritimatiellia bacterium]|nr:hypothetical protein [Kiritimatiellia bacterium]HSA17406.1 hypothetical protein [Kiritimatiellia bacterium]
MAAVLALAALAVAPAGCELVGGGEPEGGEPAPQSSGEEAAAESGSAEETAAAAGSEEPAAAGNPEEPAAAAGQEELGIAAYEYQGELFVDTFCETLPLNDGAGGFVSNPDNMHETLKFVFPASFRDQISRVTVFTSDGRFFDEFWREFPDEEDGRPRYYGTKPVELYPANMYLRVLMNDGSCRSLQHPNPQQRFT